MKILNLYAGIGGNRKLWGGRHEVTAVEYDKGIAGIYQDFFPEDEVVVCDAHEYLLENFAKFDFIWSSPPCQTHSKIRFNLGFQASRKFRKVDAKYPDLKLYEEIILLDNWYDGKYVIENTIPYYPPLITGRVMARHIWWTNIWCGNMDIQSRGHSGGTVESLSVVKGFDLSKYDILNKRQILRNCVEPEVGLHFLREAENPTRRAGGSEQESLPLGDGFLEDGNV